MIELADPVDELERWLNGKKHDAEEKIKNGNHWRSYEEDVTLKARVAMIDETVDEIRRMRNGGECIERS